MSVSISNGNTKLGGIPSVSLPRTTCNPNAPCYKTCHAGRGNFMFDNVQKAYRNNLEIWNVNPTEYENDIVNSIPVIGMFRWHVSGDIINTDYLKMMIRVANRKKQVKFLCFTKQYDIVNEYIASGNVIPKNLKIVFSAWKNFQMNNENHFPIAWMFDEKDPDERIPKSAIKCGGNCSECGICWLLKKKQNVYFNKH